MWLRRFPYWNCSIHLKVWNSAGTWAPSWLRWTRLSNSPKRNFTEVSFGGIRERMACASKWTSLRDDGCIEFDTRVGGFGTTSLPTGVVAAATDGEIIIYPDTAMYSTCSLTCEIIVWALNLERVAASRPARGWAIFFLERVHLRAKNLLLYLRIPWVTLLKYTLNS